MFDYRKTVMVVAVFAAACGIGSDAFASARSTEQFVKPKPKVGMRRASPTILGLAVGLFTSADITIKPSRLYSEYDWKLNSGYSLSGFVDLPTCAFTSIGFSLETHRIRPEGLDVEKNMLDLSINIKGNACHPRGSNVLKPCIALGYGRLPSVDYGFLKVNSSSFITLKAYFEFSHLPESGAPGFLVQLGILASPYGRGTVGSVGNMSVDVVCKPRFLLRIGTAFGD